MASALVLELRVVINHPTTNPVSMRIVGAIFIGIVIVNSVNCIGRLHSIALPIVIDINDIIVIGVVMLFSSFTIVIGFANR